MTEHGVVARDASYWASSPTALMDYVALDLSSNGPAANELMGGIDHEFHNSDQVADLVDDRSELPDNITAHMASWYRQYIAPTRLAALAAVKSRFAEDKPKSVPTFIMEARRDEILADNASRRHKAVTDFRLEYAGRIEDRDRAERDYEYQKAKHGGREPNTRSKLIYFLLLFGLAALEFLINFETLLASPVAKGVPALALGMTVAVALSIAFASHAHGKLVKQWHYHMHSAERDRKRRFIWYYGVLGTMADAIGLGLIGFGRYFLVVAIIEKAVLMGNDPPSLVGMMFGTMFGNVAIWLLGSAISYSFHDEDPTYPAYKIRYDKLNDEVTKGYQEKVVKKLQELNEVCRESLKTEEMQNNVQSSGQTFQRNRAHFDALMKKDHEVEGLLQRYRDAVRRAHPNGRFNAADSELLDPGRRKIMTSGEWAASPLRLKYISSGY
ncbi:hypothetical protein FPZ54_07725 [Sphingomonas suaedae]|uniref:Uncharacterized protein n=1 Tax=Sphingomonas suaedae TaxID=2599297 RepID=A0A518RES1_9SPHN|nr:hypothetical protein [Sphingomonas suaedae]QDX25923.1 hypothetical protein FPZ54_07725 [Sphingomonas suaedae]